jgi:hypothetical protein
VLTAGQTAHRSKQVDQVAWLLGVQVTAQVVPGADSSARRVLIGSPEAVFRQGRELYHSSWQTEFPRRANLVVAAVSGGASQQTWANVERALLAALTLVNDGGAIALCTEVKERLGPALSTLSTADTSEAAHARLRKLRTPDAPLARLLEESLDRVTIYLLSDLGEEIVSPVGFAYVSGPQEIANLTAHIDSCILLADAQYAVPNVAEE